MCNYAKDCKRRVQKLYLFSLAFQGFPDWTSSVQGSVCHCLLCVKAFSTAHRKQSCLFLPSQTTRLKMNENYSYVGVPATIQEAMEKEDCNNPVKSSEPPTLAGPEPPAVPELSAPMVVGPFLLSISRNLTSWSQGMEIAHNACRNTCFGGRSCVGPSRF
jgi:hypothetical protein